MTTMTIRVAGSDRDAVVDADDYPLLSRRQWSVSAAGYPASKVAAAGMVLMHSFVMTAKPGCVVDHVDRDKLNNTKANLRLVRARQNVQNAPIRAHSRQPYKGVRRSGSRWVARIRFAGREKHLGSFSTPEEAAAAYDSAARQLYEGHVYINGVTS